MWSLKKLEKILKDNGVDISKWGKGEAKTLNHLLQELIKDECKLEIKGGKVIRIVHALSINVIYKGEVLKEEYQRFKDGRIRKRKMDCSVAEKIHDDEIKDLNKAVKRALSEELRIKDISDEQIAKLPQISRTRPSGSYPGTDMDMVLYKFNVVLKYHQYDPHGYVEHQEDKDTYFVWMQNSNLKRYGWKTNEGIRLTKTAHNKQKKELIDITQLKREIKSIEPVLTDLNYDVLYTTTPWTSGDFSLTISIYDKIEIPNNPGSSRMVSNSEEYEEFKDRLWDICEEHGYKCETMGKYGTYFEIKKKPHISKQKKILENSKYRKDLDYMKSLIRVGNEIKSIAHILTDVGFKIKCGRYCDRINIGFYVYLEVLKWHVSDNTLKGYWVRSNREPHACDEYEEFKDRVEDICKKEKLYVYYQTPNEILISESYTMKDRVYIEKNIRDYTPIIESVGNIKYDISVSSKDKNILKDLNNIESEIETISHIITDDNKKLQVSILFDKKLFIPFILINILKYNGEFSNWIRNYDKSEENDEFKDRLTEICSKFGFNCIDKGYILVTNMSDFTPDIDYNNSFGIRKSIIYPKN